MAWPRHPPLKAAMNDKTHIHARLSRARALIDACYDRPLDLEQIAREASFPRYYSIRLFRRAFEPTPNQYIMRRRIERAKELLAADTLSITEVCRGSEAQGGRVPGAA